MNPPLEIWGGHECTVNRVGDRFRDQTAMSGHQDRIEDLDLFAGLGLRRLRYPLIWERTEISPGVFDWSWADRRLSRLRELGLKPIVGLVHHGSGPAWTSLLDSGFTDGLARFAEAAACRYPWIDSWTPVNEPLTTARFSCLYGHWHPHRRDEVDFWLAMLNQIEAVDRAMVAVRAVIPDARLIQTEDFGATRGTAPCDEQVSYENDRRLMTWDLQTSRVRPGHPMWSRLEELGLGSRLDRLAETVRPPDVLGLNHYVTSDRFLDHRLDRYPAGTHGGNGRLRYADVEAVRVLDDLPCGWSHCLGVLGRRYDLPIAITECHLGCDEAEQVRWMADAWQAAIHARQAGLKVEALTAWSLLGAYDWDSLLTGDNGHYEPGVFDLADGAPRPTRLARLVRDLAVDGSPACDMAPDGWWRRPERLLYPETPPLLESAP